MKKLTTMLAAGSMLVGLAACGGNTTTPWQNKVISFLQEQGYAANLPLDELAKLGVGAVSVETDKEGNQVAKAVIKGDVTFEKFVNVLRPMILGEWVMTDADETESAQGHYVYSFKNDFQAEGQFANVEFEMYETGNRFEVDPCIILKTSKGQGQSAAEVQALLDEVLENVDGEALFLPESSLADVADWYSAEVEYTDMTIEFADVLVSYLTMCDGAEYKATDYYYESMGVIYVYNYDELPDATLEAAATRFDTYLKNAGLFTVVDKMAYVEEDESWEAYYEVAEAIGVEVMVYDDEEYGRCVDFYLYAVSEDAFYASEIAIATPDFEEEGVAALNEIIDDESYDIDATFEDTYGYFAWGKKEVKPEQSVQVQYLTVNSELKLYVSLGDVRSEWPAAEIEALAADFTTAVPSLEGTVWAEVGDGYVFISNLDKADHKEESSFEQEYLPLFDEAEWDVEEGNIDMGIEVPGYVASSKEVINVDGENQVLVVLFFTYNYQFFCEVHISAAPSAWFGDRVAAFAAPFETAVPSMDGEVWYFVDESEVAGDIALYCQDESEGTGKESDLVKTYLAKFNESEWTVEDYQGVGYVATSKEMQTVKGVVLYLTVTFYSYKGTFYVFVEKVQAAEAINVDRINELLAEQGWDVQLDSEVLAALGDCAVEYEEEYNEELDEWFIQFTLVTLTEPSLNAIIAGFATAMGLEGPYKGQYYDYGYLNLVWVNNVDTMDLYFEVLSPDDAVLWVMLYIDQAPTSSVE